MNLQRKSYYINIIHNQPYSTCIPFKGLSYSISAVFGWYMTTFLSSTQRFSFNQHQNKWQPARKTKPKQIVMTQWQQYATRRMQSESISRIYRPGATSGELSTHHPKSRKSTKTKTHGCTEKMRSDSSRIAWPLCDKVAGVTRFYFCRRRPWRGKTKTPRGTNVGRRRRRRRGAARVEKRTREFPLRPSAPIHELIAVVER